MRVVWFHSNQALTLVFPAPLALIHDVVSSNHVTCNIPDVNCIIRTLISYVEHRIESKFSNSFEFKSNSKSIYVFDF
jgi:hypothetical protein